MYGSLEPIDYQITSSGGVTFKRNKPIEGVASLIQRRYYETILQCQKIIIVPS